MRLALLAFFAWAFPFVLLAKPIPGMRSDPLQSCEERV